MANIDALVEKLKNLAMKANKDNVDLLIGTTILQEVLKSVKLELIMDEKYGADCDLVKQINTALVLTQL